jgi:hypothetical protein
MNGFFQERQKPKSLSTGHRQGRSIAAGGPGDLSLPEFFEDLPAGLPPSALGACVAGPPKCAEAMEVADHRRRPRISRPRPTGASSSLRLRLQQVFFRGFEENLIRTDLSKLRPEVVRHRASSDGTSSPAANQSKINSQRAPLVLKNAR